MYGLAIGKGGIPRIMADKKCRNSAVTDLVTNEAAKIPAQVRIKRGKRLIHQQGVRFCQQRSHQGNPRRLPTRQCGRVPIRESGKPGHIKRCPDAVLPIVPMPRRKAEGKIVAHRHMGKQQGILEHQPDAPVLGRPATYIGAIQRHLPGPAECRERRAADDAEKCGFPAATRPLN